MAFCDGLVDSETRMEEFGRDILEDVIGRSRASVGAKLFISTGGVCRINLGEN